MNTYNIVKQLIPTLFLLASIAGTILFTYLYLINKVASPQWAILFALVGILTILFTILDKEKTRKETTNKTKPTDTTNSRIHRILDIIFYIGLSILLIALITNEIRSFPYIYHLLMHLINLDVYYLKY